MPDEGRGVARRPTRVRSRGTGRGRATEPARIREAGPDDLEPIVRLRVALAREEAASGSAARPGPGAAERLRALTQRQLLDPDAVMFLALAGSREVGILRCADGGRLRPARRHALVTTAYVTRSHRRRGVLRALLACAEAWCRARGAQGMRLRVGSGNSAGHAAWLSLGFAPQAVLMRRPLAD